MGAKSELSINLANTIHYTLAITEIHSTHTPGSNPFQQLFHTSGLPQLML